MNKNKSNLGGVRVGAGRPCKWRRPTKVIRVPIEFLDEVLKLIDYMAANGGELPLREYFPYTRDPNELPYPSRFKSRGFILHSDEENDSEEIEAVEADAEWRKNYLKDLMARRAQQARPPSL